MRHTCDCIKGDWFLPIEYFEYLPICRQRGPSATLAPSALSALYSVAAAVVAMTSLLLRRYSNNSSGVKM